MKRIFACLFFALSVSAAAQQPQCGNANETFAAEMQRQAIISQIRNSPAYLARNISAITYIAVKMHLFGQDDNTGYATNHKVNNMLAILNAEFQPVNIQFYFRGTDFSRYPNSEFNQGQQTEAEALDFHYAFCAYNSMNVYVAQNVMIGFDPVAGWSYVTPVSPGNNRMFLATDWIEGVAPHEFGHYFGLAHTFNASDGYIPDRELVTRNFNELPPRLPANCDVKGDFVCDTESDPYFLPGYSSADCSYTGTEFDVNGDPFIPDLTNIMGYEGCAPKHFTAGQYDKMGDGLLIVSNPLNDFILTAPEIMQPAPSNLTAASGNPEYVGPITLSWTDNSNTETGYIIERSISGSGPFTAILGVGANVTSTSSIPVEVGATYFYRIKPSNSKTNYSNISVPLTTPILCGTEFVESCSNANPVQPAARIESFKLRRNATVLINNPASGCSGNSIGNFYDEFAAVVSPADALNFEVKSKLHSITGEGYYINVGIYADWNNDNDFYDPGETLVSSAQTFYQNSGIFNIPSGLANGEYRLRVVLTVGGPLSPCGTSAGETEDYKLIVDPSLAIENITVKKGISVWPNPTSDFLEIESEINPDKIIVTDMTGKIVLTQTTDTKKANVGMLASGIYIIKAYSGGKKFQAKFVKL